MQFVVRGYIHLEPGWFTTRMSDTNLSDKEQIWPGIHTVGAEALRSWKFFIFDAPNDIRVCDGDLFNNELDGTWLAAARDRLYRAPEVCIEKDPLGKPKLREAIVDKFKLFTAMALAAS
eukprot:jgi/Tetstr1/449935/TSEL_036989.t1